MEQLEKYYNEKFKQKGDPEFKELSEEDKSSIEKSLEFCAYQFCAGCRDVGEQLNKVLINISKQLKNK